MSIKDLRLERLEDEIRDTLLKLYKINTCVKIGEKKWYLPYRYYECGDVIYKFETRPDDTWIVTHPRSGTTVTQELTWLVANNMNFEEAKRRPLMNRFPLIDLDTITDISLNEPSSKIFNVYNAKSTVEFLKNQSSPRFIKSHMPLELLPTVVNSNCKIIYIARNPRDVVVSWYNFQKDLDHMMYQGNFEQFCDLFMNNLTMWGPYWEHVKEAWSMRHRVNTMFLFYEDIIEDLPSNIKKIAAFFNKTYSDEQIAKLVEHLNIQNFRKNPMVNQMCPLSAMTPETFIRQGITGGWKEIFTLEIEDRFSKWMSDNLKDTDLTFPS